MIAANHVGEWFSINLIADNVELYKKTKIPSRET